MEFHVQLLQIQARQVAPSRPPSGAATAIPPGSGPGRTAGSGSRWICLAGLRHELLDLGPPVDRRPVPDHQQPIPGQAAQMDEELDAVQPVQRGRPHQRVDLALAA